MFRFLPERPHELVESDAEWAEIDPSAFRRIEQHRMTAFERVELEVVIPLAELEDSISVTPLDDSVVARTGIDDGITVIGIGKDSVIARTELDHRTLAPVTDTGAALLDYHGGAHSVPADEETGALDVEKIHRVVEAALDLDISISAIEHIEDIVVALDLEVSPAAVEHVDDDVVAVFDLGVPGLTDVERRVTAVLDLDALADRSQNRDIRAAGIHDPDFTAHRTGDDRRVPGVDDLQIAAVLTELIVVDDLAEFALEAISQRPQLHIADHRADLRRGTVAEDREVADHIGLEVLSGKENLLHPLERPGGVEEFVHVGLSQKLKCSRRPSAQCGTVRGRYISIYLIICQYCAVDSLYPLKQPLMRPHCQLFAGIVVGMSAASPFSETIVISVGGSLIVPDQIDTAFLTTLKALIVDDAAHASRRFIIITGGGRTARRYQEAAAAVTKLTTDDLDWLGIHATRLNGHLVRTIFRNIAHPVMVTNPDEVLDVPSDTRLVVASGYRPGASTDLRAIQIAHRVGARKVINLSNIDYVYTADPRINPDAEKIETISWAEFRKIIPEKWDPGLSSPFDPVAAREAEQLGIEVAIINGAALCELGKYLNDEAFIGTKIT